MNIRLFDEGVVNATTAAGLSDEMRVFYSDYLVDNAQPKLIHDQFGQKCFIPRQGGKTISFRRYDPLAKALGTLEEGVTPAGQSICVDAQEATVSQYGGYIELSDVLITAAVDNNLVQATKLLGSQAGRTLDTITREVLNGGTNVQYGEDAVQARYKLVGGEASGNHYLTVDAVRRAVRALKAMNADTINGSYVGIIHPDCVYDLMSDPKWLNVKSYSDPAGIYEGEIGKIENVRFVESTEAKIFHADDLTGDARTLTAAANVTASTAVAVDETLTADELKGRYVLIGTGRYKVMGNTTDTLTLDAAVTCSDGDIIYPGEAGAKGRDVYSTLIIGDNAYGTTELAGGGLEHIIKQLGSAGTDDPLNQRSSVGWKATKVSVRLVEAFMRRIETTSTFQSGAN